MDFGKTVLLFLSVLGLSWWVGLVMKAEGEDKLREACHPVSFVMEKVGSISEGLVGFHPQWAIKSKKFLEGGCYYFASVVLFGGELGEGEEAEKGGIHK